MRFVPRLGRKDTEMRIYAIMMDKGEIILEGISFQKEETVEFAQRYSNVIQSHLTVIALEKVDSEDTDINPEKFDG